MRGCRSHRTLILLASLVAPAAIAGEGPYLGLEAAATFARPQTLQQAGSEFGRVRFDTGYLGGLVFGSTTRIGLRPELELSFRSSDVDRFTDASGVSSTSPARLDAYGALFNLWYEARARDGALSFVHPYLGVGVGGVRLQFRDTDFAGVDSGDDGRTLLAYQGGAGIGFDATDFVTVGLDYRYFQSNRGKFRLDESDGRVSARYQAHTIGASVRFSFAGSEYRHARVVRPQPVAVAPPRAYVPPVDTDGDGVPDELDRCSGTPPGFKVDLEGCIVQQSVVLQAVDFEPGSDRLTAQAKATLDSVAAALNGQSGLTVEIGGYTDSKGNALANLRLSERRARAVLEYLVTRRVPRASLRAKGYGQARPIADNATEEGRAQNRRVEFQVLNTPPTVKVIERKAPNKPKRTR
ncbi:MAG TPA: OmpA family protein [Nevskiaceae bacterium]|nr:OmpA family protein [Nevskiaceae bacterium]